MKDFIHRPIMAELPKGATLQDIKRVFGNELYGIEHKGGKSNAIIGYITINNQGGIQ